MNIRVSALIVVAIATPISRSFEGPEANRRAPLLHPPRDSLSVAKKIRGLVGPYVQSSSVASLGDVFARYESDFVKYDEAQWAVCRGQWDCGNGFDYYDRAMIYYVWWQRTGLTKYLERANATALNYRQKYLEPNNYGIIFNWYMTDGVALHYVVTGDPMSLKAVGQLADQAAYVVNVDAWGYFAGAQTDNRIQAYALKTLLLAYKLNAPSTGAVGGIPGGNDWATVLRTALTKILANRDGDGQWRMLHCAASPWPSGKATDPFEVGLLYDGLVRYYTLFEPDARILPAIQRSVDILWRDNWLSASNAFKYMEVNCPEESGSTNPAPDLNNLIVNGFGWVYRMTGDANYKTKADAIFAGGVVNMPIAIGAGQPKQFNQEYTSSYRYLTWR
jgi:hypothetical protein